MAKITHVVVSDIHAGATASLATFWDDATQQPVFDTPSLTATAFGAAVHDFLARHNQDHFGSDTAGDARPQLILLGDLLDLAFSNRGDAGKSYLSWLTALTGGDATWFRDDSVFLPGNHDHSLWTGARIAAEAAHASVGNIGGLPSSTSAIGRGALPAPLLTALNALGGLAGGVLTRYPNMALVSEDKSKAVALHHGHFIDNNYRLMSALFDALSGDHRKYPSAKSLADENANWIDFGWSSFGEAADTCRMINDLYAGAENGQEARLIRERAGRLIEQKFADHLPMGGDPRVKKLFRMAVQSALDATFGAWSDSERFSKTEILSSDGVDNLKAYIEGAVKPQLMDELGQVPDDLTFIFGHTHKPFVDEIVCATGASVATANTGGWYLDNERLDSKDGASMVLIDEDLNVVSVQYFSVPTNDVAVPVMVDLVSKPSPGAQAFYDEVLGYVQANDEVWMTLTTTAAAAYKVRQQILFDALDAMNAQADITGDVV
jgi:hypothetical protein